MDTVQKNDFVPVGKDDLAWVGQEPEEEEIHFAPSSDTPKVPATIEQQATVEDLQSIMLDNVTSVSPFQKDTPPAKDPVSPEISPVENDILEATVEQPAVVEAETPAPEISAPQDLLSDISLWETESPTEIVEDNSNTEVTTGVEVSAPLQEADTSVEAIEENNGLDSISLDLPDATAQEEVAPAIEAAPSIEESPTQEEAPLDTSGLWDIVIPTDAATPEQVQQEQEQVQDIQPEEQVSTDNGGMDLSSIDMTPAPVVEIEQESATTEQPTPTTQEVVSSEEGAPAPDTNMFDNLDSLQESIQQNPVESAPEETIPEVVVPAVETQVVENTVDNTAQENTLSIEEQSATPTQEDSSEAVPSTPVSAESAALETIANDISEWIDLDSLMPNANPAPAVQTATPVPTATIVEPAKKTLLSGIVWDNPSSQKKALIGLWLFAALWLAFFAYQLMASSSTAETPVINPSTPVEQWNDIGDTPAEDSTEETTPITTGEDTTQETTTGEQQGTVEESTWSTITPPIPVAKTRDELVLIAKKMADDTRSTLIKATINKNVDARASAFALQKDIETFKQALEKTNDITTLNDSEKSADALQQRLDAIIQQLNGSSQ